MTVTLDRAMVVRLMAEIIDYNEWQFTKLQELLELVGGPLTEADGAPALAELGVRIDAAYARVQNALEMVNITWHQTPGRLTGHPIYHDNAAGWRDSRYVLQPIMTRTGRLSRYEVSFADGDDVTVLGEAKTADAAKALAERHATGGS